VIKTNFFITVILFFLVRHNAGLIIKTIQTPRVFRDYTPPGFPKKYLIWNRGGPRGKLQKMSAGEKQTNCLVPETKQFNGLLKASCPRTVAFWDARVSLPFWN
jgi:hypothetical protein